MATPRVLVVPGGTSAGAAALANASLHKLVELHEERQADPSHPAPRTIVVLRDPDQVPPSTLRGAALAPSEAFPADEYPDIAAHVDDPGFFDGVDLVIPTSGSSAGSPRLGGISTDALVASAKATEAALSGPGRWILALPTHHIAGAMVLVRSAVAGTDPQIVDCTDGFDPRDLLPAVEGATRDGAAGYLAVVPTQLSACLDAGDEVVAALRGLSAILVGGAATNHLLLERAKGMGLPVVTSYGMTETCGGCVYDGVPLPGTTVRAIDQGIHMRLAIAGDTLMTRYLTGDQPFFEECGHRWLITADIGIILASGLVEVRGRADDVIVSGGLSIAPAPIRRCIRQLDEASDAWIMPTDDTKWGQVVTALIVPREAPIDATAMASLGQRIRDHVASTLGRMQAPRRVVAVDSLPYLGFDKIDRAAAAQAAAEASGTEREWVR